jgi:DUF4097 and DUF4098 domain-containing protein YvlB
MAQEKWMVDGPKVIDLDLVRTLKISLVGGQVDIVAHDEPGARVEVHSVSGKDLKISIDGDTLDIDHPQLAWDNFIDVFSSFRSSARADVSVMVPRDVALKFGVVSASALVSGLTSDPSISSVTGDVAIDGLTGSLGINTVNGEVSVRDHTGKITARTVNGPVTATGHINEFVCDGVTGDVFLDVAGEPSDIRINTVSGNITARVEPQVATQYKINTVSGRVQLDGSEFTGIHAGYTGKYGTLDRSFLTFRANTVSGAISVLHAVTV